MLPTKSFGVFTPLLLLVTTASGALVSVQNWGSNPTGLQMSIYVPSKLAAKPAVIFALHPCGGSGQQYYQTTKYPALADQSGFIVVYPSAPHDNNCWDVASTKSLTHDGGGDSNGLANMIKYTISKYNADPTKIFVTGSSSGGMMTNVMAAVYPDLVAATSVYSGVPAGCLAGSPGSSPSTANPDCANGKITKTSAAWGAQVRAMYPGYSGTYPKTQIWHGTADSFVNYYYNFGEQVKEWSGLLGVNYVRNNTNVPQSGYTQETFGDGTKLVAYSAAGVGHTVPVHETVDLTWFGI
ncbi:PHB depolymerase family esterase protein [Rutstroemia sp. NJR-2017a WRK4]|nr:PHB depolymerase family esterase protein [Rutstroemia sp. NJR-2017a WRK4]